MKGRVGVAASIHYRHMLLPKITYKLGYIEKLSDRAKIKFKAVNLYESGRYPVAQICPDI